MINLYNIITVLCLFAFVAEIMLFINLLLRFIIPRKLFVLSIYWFLYLIWVTFKHFLYFYEIKEKIDWTNKIQIVLFTFITYLLYNIVKNYSYKRMN